MGKDVKILVIVEGNKSESILCRQIERVYSMNLEICCFGTNIYSLYKKLEEYGFNADIKQVLTEIHPEYRDGLARNFAYTYLFFDLDPHHTKQNESRNLNKIVKDNVLKVKRMCEFFVDETDPTIGKLYVNYPMLESFKDCDSTFDIRYREEYVRLEDIVHFKQHVNDKLMSRKRVDNYSMKDFDNLIRQNVFKLNSIISGVWGEMTYEEFIKNSDGNSILEEQRRFIDESGEIAVLNTLLFFILDYYGNRNNFYDKLIFEC